MLFLNVVIILLLVLCFSALVDLSDVNNNTTLTFGNGTTFTTSSLKTAAQDMLVIPDGLDPFSRGLLKSFVADKPETARFFDYIFNGFRHTMIKFFPIARESWETLLSVAFISYVQDHKGTHLEIMMKVILPEYPLLANEPFDEIMSILFDEEGEYIGSPMPLILLEAKACKIFCKTYMENNQNPEFNFKNLLREARKSASMIPPASKYHWAFLFAADRRRLPKVNLDFEDFDLCFAYLAENVYNHSVADYETVEKNLCMILPFVYDNIHKNLGYLDVINRYVLSERVTILEDDFHNFITNLGGSTAAKFFSEEQVDFFHKLGSGTAASRLVLSYIAWYMEVPDNSSVINNLALHSNRWTLFGFTLFPETSSVNRALALHSNQWRLFGFTLYHRISTIYPGFMKEHFDISPETFERCHSHSYSARDTSDYWFTICAYEAKSNTVLGREYPMYLIAYFKYSQLVYFGARRELGSEIILQVRIWGDKKAINIINRSYPKIR